CAAEGNELLDDDCPGPDRGQQQPEHDHLDHRMGGHEKLEEGKAARGKLDFRRVHSLLVQARLVEDEVPPVPVPGKRRRHRGPSTGGPSTGGPSTRGPSTGGPSTRGPSTGGPSRGCANARPRRARSGGASSSL